MHGPGRAWPQRIVSGPPPAGGPSAGARPTYSGPRPAPAHGPRQPTARTGSRPGIGPAQSGSFGRVGFGRISEAELEAEALQSRRSCSGCCGLVAAVLAQDWSRYLGGGRRKWRPRWSETTAPSGHRQSTTCE
jgi:hypothetical protein